MAEPITNGRWHRLMDYHRAQLSVRRADVCFVGDSLAEAWEHEGASPWQRLTKGLRAVNCGISGDRTEQILYRLQRIELKRARPRMIVLWLGTNNLSADMPDSPEAVMRGIQAAIKTIKNASPETKIILLSLLPTVLQTRRSNDRSRKPIGFSPS
jgi:lysophospholipase L1-like esterase